ncbi:twin-arginine translocation signal domain-containing protein, partial [Paraburkholderia sp.]
MTDHSSPPPRPSRRGFLKAGGAAVAAGASLAT